MTSREPHRSPEVRLDGDTLARRAEGELARGEEEAAAATFLEAYEAKPLLAWLKAHCELTAIAFTATTRTPRAPWSVSPVERLWMYSFIQRVLAREGAKLDARATGDALLVAGCDHTPRFTRAWALRANVDRVALYQSLAVRAGFCDCEVLLHAANDDDQALASVLISGFASVRARAGASEPGELGESASEGAAEGATRVGWKPSSPSELTASRMTETGTVERAAGDLLVRGTPPPPALAVVAEDDEVADVVTIDVRADGLRIEPQLVAGALVGDIVETLSRTALGDVNVTLLVAYPDRHGVMELVSLASRVSTSTSTRVLVARVEPLAISASVPEWLPWLPADVLTLTAILRTRERPPTPCSR